MTGTRPRRLASMAAFIVAGIASIATTQIPTISDRVEGAVVVSHPRTQLEVSVALRRNVAIRESRLQLSALDGYIPNPGALPTEGTAKQPIVARFTFLGEGGRQTDWMPLPAFTELDTHVCVTPECKLDYLVEIDPVTASTPFVFRWQLDAYAQGAEVFGALELTVAAEPAPPPIRYPVWTGLSIGVLGAILMAGLAVTIRRHRAAALLHGSQAVALSICGFALVPAWLEGRLSVLAAPALIAAACALGAALAVDRKRPTIAPPLVAAVGLLLPALMLTAFSGTALYRESEVVVGFLAVGYGATVAALTTLVAVRDAHRDLTPIRARTLATGIAVAVGIGVSEGHAVVAMAPLRVGGLGTALPAITVAVLLAATYWAWLRTGTRVLALAGLSLPLTGALIWIVPALDLVLALGERRIDRPLTDYLPWAVLSASGLLIFVATWRKVPAPQTLGEPSDAVDPIRTQ